MRKQAEKPTDFTNLAFLMEKNMREKTKSSEGLPRIIPQIAARS